MNSNKPIWEQKPQQQMKRFHISQPEKLTILIGEPPEPSPELKIKDNAVHVGHSQPPDVWKVSTSLILKHYYHSVNNNSLIVQDHMEIWDVMED